MTYINLPMPLQQSPSWLVANQDKIPVQPMSNQRLAGDRQPHVLAFQEARPLIDSGHHHYLIYYHHRNEPYSSLDIDQGIDDQGQMTDWCQQFLQQQQLYGYVEYSSSKTGLRVPLTGKITKNKQIYYPTDDHGPGCAKFELVSREHPMTYTGDRLPDCQRPDDVPDLQPVVAYLTHHYPPAAEPEVRPVFTGHRGNGQDTDPELVRQALSWLPADLNHNDWKTIGMALHDGFQGDSRGFQLWDDWSSQGDSYKAKEVLQAWNSFKPGKGVTLGTLFKMAQDRGFQFPKRSTKDHQAAGQAVKTKPDKQQKSEHRFRNSMALIDGYCQLQKQQPGWHYVTTENHQKMSYSLHEDNLIVWAQDRHLPKDLYERRPLSASYRLIQERQYQQLVSNIATTLTQTPKDHHCHFFQLAEKIGLQRVEQLVLFWWLADRKKVLLQLAKGENPTPSQVPMPILHGHEQNTGKSYLVSQLCQPLGELAEVKQISNISDEFGHLQWGKLLIANFDELVGLDRGDIKVFKQWCYCDRYSKRKMHSEMMHHITKITAGIGSSNQPIAELVNDTSGTRRLFDIQTPNDRRMVQIARDFDFLSLWQNQPIDMHPSPDELQEIRSVQNQQRRRDPVEEWFDDSGRNLMQINTQRSMNTAMVDLYRDYQKWSYQYGVYPDSCAVFGRLLNKHFSQELDYMRSNGSFYRLKKPPEQAPD